MAHPYNHTHALAFPVLPVRLLSITGNNASPSTPALIDTGADATLVPESVLKAIGAEDIFIARLRSYWGEPRPAKVYLVDVEVDGQVFPSIEVLGDEQGSSILLGRNVLNKIILLLDGPMEESEILSHRPRRHP